MPSSTTAMVPEIKPKSNRRFLHFSSPFGSLPSLPSLSSTATSNPHTPPVPPIPPLSDSLTSLSPRPPLRSQPSASSLGAGATIVRRPSDARREMIPNIGGGKAISHRSLSASAAAALSRSLTSRLRGETLPTAGRVDQAPMDEFGRLDLSGKGRREIRISPPIPARAPGRMSVLPTAPVASRGQEEGYCVEVMPLRTSDGSYTSSNSIGTTGTAGTDSTATDSIALKTPRTPYTPRTTRDVPPKSAMRKPISPQVSLPNLSAVHPYVHAGTGPGHAAHPSIDSLASCTSINALTGRRERTPSREMHRRSTLKPPPRGALPPTPPTAASALMPAFHAIPMGVSFTPANPYLGGVEAEIVLVKLHFAYSLGANHDTSPITIPWNQLLPCGGGLVDFVGKQLQAYRLSQSFPPSKLSLPGPSSRAVNSQRGRRGSFAESVDSDYGDHDAETLCPALLGLSDGDSVEESDGVDSKRDSDYGYTELLRGQFSSSPAEDRDEYLKSLWTDSPAQPDFTQSIPPMPITHAYPTPPKHRAKTRNQYVLKATTTPTLPPLPPLPSRISFGSTPPLQIRRSPSLPNTAAPPVVERGGAGTDHTRRPSVDSALPLARVHHTAISDRPAGGTGTGVLLVQVLLLRNAEAYHLITHRLIRQSWPVFAPGMRRKVEEEVRYLGMPELVLEVKREKSGVIKGGEGYI